MEAAPNAQRRSAGLNRRALAGSVSKQRPVVKGSFRRWHGSFGFINAHWVTPCRSPAAAPLLGKIVPPVPLFTNDRSSGNLA
jgi:hypothetical protein